ncbi:MAG: DUF1838 family protein [Woeseiaceae bacterium]
MKYKVLLLVGALLSVPAQAELDPNDPTDAMTISRKVQCSATDGQAVTYNWFGNMYVRKAGQRDKKLFAIEGMNVRQCTAVSDEKRGDGYKMVSREIMLYKDPDTGEVLSTWENPYTGETVDVLHVANDPVNFAQYETGRDGKPAQWPGVIEGATWRQQTTVPLFYPNPLASEYQKQIGGTYHATEMFNFFGDSADLLSEEGATARTHVGWVRMSTWLPWMNMQGREGLLYVHASGKKLDSWDDLSETMKAEIYEYFPDYVAPPPADDERRNETSWIYYKRIQDGERVAPKRD